MLSSVLPVYLSHFSISRILSVYVFLLVSISNFKPWTVWALCFNCLIIFFWNFFKQFMCFFQNLVILSIVSLREFFISSSFWIIVTNLYWMSFYSVSSRLICSDLFIVEPLGFVGTILIFMFLDVFFHCCLPNSFFSGCKLVQCFRRYLFLHLVKMGAVA